MARRPNGSGSATDLAAETLLGDVRDRFLERLRSSWSDRPWEKRSAADQTAVIEDLEGVVRDTITRAVVMIAAESAEPVRGRLVKVAAKDVIQCQVDIMRSEAGRHRIVDGIGSLVLLTVADASAFMGERGRARIDADQPELPQAAE